MTPPSDNKPTGENAEAKGDGQQQQIANLESEIRKGEVWIIRLTAAMAFFALCGVVVGFLQWGTYKGQLGVMQGRLDQMKDTHLLAETHALAINAGTQAKNVADEVAKIKDLVDATNRQWNTMKEQLAIAERNCVPWIGLERDTLVPVNSPVVLAPTGDGANWNAS